MRLSGNSDASQGLTKRKVGSIFYVIHRAPVDLLQSNVVSRTLRRDVACLCAEYLQIVVSYTAIIGPFECSADASVIAAVLRDCGSETSVEETIPDSLRHHRVISLSCEPFGSPTFETAVDFAVRTKRLIDGRPLENRDHMLVQMAFSTPHPSERHRLWRRWWIVANVLGDDPSGILGRVLEGMLWGEDNFRCLFVQLGSMAVTLRSLTALLELSNCMAARRYVQW